MHARKGAAARLKERDRVTSIAKAERCWKLVAQGEAKQQKKEAKLMSLMAVDLCIDTARANIRASAFRTRKDQEAWLKNQLNAWKMRLPHLQKGLLRRGCFGEHKANLLGLLIQVISAEAHCLPAAGEPDEKSGSDEEPNAESQKKGAERTEEKEQQAQPTSSQVLEEQEAVMEEQVIVDDEVVWERCERSLRGGRGRCDKWRLLDVPFQREGQKKFMCSSVGSSCREECDWCECRVCVCEPDEE